MSKAAVGGLVSCFAELLVPCFFVILAVFYSPYLHKFEINQDEGINLMKAALLSRGYPLYQSVWSDHPPFFTYLLLPIVRFFGASVLAPRIMCIAVSSLLVWACCHFMRLTFGRLHAILAGLLVITVPFFLPLATAVLIGVPAISFAMLSLAAAGHWHVYRSRRWLVFSAVASALSVFTKGFTVPLIPILVIGITIQCWTDDHRRSQAERFSSVALWACAFSATSLIFVVGILGRAGLDQLFSTHVAAMDVAAYRDREDFSLSYYLGAARWILLLAAAGTLLSIARKRWMALYLAAWVAGSIAVLLRYNPVWFHHHLLFTIPAAALAAVPLAELALVSQRLLLSKRRVLLDPFMGISAAALAGWLLMQTNLPGAAAVWNASVHNPRSERFPPPPVIPLMKEHSHGSDWVVTDLPMYAFKAGLLVPPNLAVVSDKRLRTGVLTPRMIIGAVRDFRPSTILLGRFPLRSVRRYARKHYSLIYSVGGRELFVAKNHIDATE